MKISVIGGTGNQGKGLTLRLAKAGHDVAIGSRSAEKAKECAAAIREAHPEFAVAGMSNADAAAYGEIAVMTLPFAAQPDIVPGLAPHLEGRIVVDTTVALIPGKPPTIADVPEGSSGVRLKAMLGNGVRLVTAFHTISAHMLERLDRPLTGDTLVAGDDPEAKEAVIRLAESIGLRGLDAGPLHVSKTLESITAMLIGMNMRYKRKSIGISFVNI
jgi:hypothetical protein